MRNSYELGTHDFTAVSWNLHKGRSPLGRQVWRPMQDWVASAAAEMRSATAAMKSTAAPSAAPSWSRVNSAGQKGR